MPSDQWKSSRDRRTARRSAAAEINESAIERRLRSEYPQWYEDNLTHSKERGIKRQYIVCVSCGRKHTSDDPPARRGGRMRCLDCGGNVCLDHQLGDCK